MPNACPSGHSDTPCVRPRAQPNIPKPSVQPIPTNVTRSVDDKPDTTSQTALSDQPGTRPSIRSNPSVDHSPSVNGGADEYARQRRGRPHLGVSRCGARGASEYRGEHRP